MPVIGHFEVVEVNGELRSHCSVHWNDEVADLFEIDEFRIAQIFSVLGSEVRLAILRALTEKPRTAAELVSLLGFRTTGQAYHHLKVLQIQSYVTQKEGGLFHLESRMARIYFACLALAWNAGARKGENA
jgi:DNA-binding transcriptional ArsR family regulator